MLSFKNRQAIFRISAWVIILGGLMLTAIAFAAVYNWERQKLQANFQRAAENRYAALKREIDMDIDSLSSVRAFYLHAKAVTRSEFHDFTASLFLQHPGIQALEWVPRVPYSQREKYEKAARRDGLKDFQITEQSVSGKMTRAGRRDEYSPVYFVEPYKGNEPALGYDLASNPLRKEALDRSRDTGELSATARITLVQEKEGKFVFLVFSPVYKRHMPIDSRQDRRDHLWGFAVGVFRIHDIVKRSLTYLTPLGIDFYLYDNSARKEERFLHFHSSSLQKTTDSLTDNEYPLPDGSLKIVRTLKVADREWQVLFVATPDYVASGKTWQPWGVLAAGLLLTGLLAGFLIASARRAEELRLSEERFRGIFEEGPVGIVLANPDQKVVAANNVLCGLLGYSEQELVGQNLIDLTYEEDREKSRVWTGQLLEGSIPRFRWEKRYIRKDGGIMWVNITATTFHGKDTPMPYFLGIIEDLTERRKAADKIHLLAYYDSLTGLPNRTFHKELMQRSIEHAKRHKEIFALIYIGLDNFQRINDTFGHSIGDLLLKAVAD
ncbi:MAG: CHASE domain-containing protein, partial [Pseudomonadota bacterium]